MMFTWNNYMPSVLSNVIRQNGPFRWFFSSLIDIQKYRQQMNDEYHAQWFPLNKLPGLIFDHKR